MSYYADIVDSAITIPIDRQDEAVRAVKAAVSNGGLQVADAEQLDDVSTIDEIFDADGYETTFQDQVGSTFILQCNYARKWRDEGMLLFSVLAPFVSDGSYIEFHGEDHGLWRIEFEGGVAYVRDGEIVWSERQTVGQAVDHARQVEEAIREGTMRR